MAKTHTPKIDAVLDAIDTAMYETVECGTLDIESGHVDVHTYVRPITHDGWKTIVVDAGRLSTVVTYRPSKAGVREMRVHANKTVIRAIENAIASGVNAGQMEVIAY